MYDIEVAVGGENKTLYTIPKIAWTANLAMSVCPSSLFNFSLKQILF